MWKKTQMIQFANGNYTNWYLGKKKIPKKKRLTVPILFENNQLVLQFLGKKKNTIRINKSKHKSAQHIK